MSNLTLNLSIDINDQDQVGKVIIMLQSISGTPVLVTPEQTVETPKTGRRSKDKAAHAPEASVAEMVPEEAPVAEASSESTEGIKIEDIRSLLAKKVGNNRDGIKAKLTELGANNVSTMDKSHFPAFMEFLKGLK